MPLTKRSPGRSGNNDASDHTEHGDGATSGNGFANRSGERAADRTSNDGPSAGSSKTSKKFTLVFEETLEKLLEEKEAGEEGVWRNGRRDGDLARPSLGWIEVVRKVSAMLVSDDRTAMLSTSARVDWLRDLFFPIYSSQ